VQWGILLSLGRLVDIGTLSVQNSNQVEVTVAGRLPNDPEAELGLRILADVEGGFQLTIESSS